MSELITVARPYAKAVFDVAVQQHHLDKWLNMLSFAAQVSGEPQVVELLSGALTPQAQANLFLSLCKDQLDEYGQNLIKIMSENNRLTALPEVLALFIQYKENKEMTAEVDVISACELNEHQQEKITSAMAKRLSRKVKLNCRIDKSILAGVIIRSGDLVIDGSVKGRLQRLADTLQS